jgi:hypothetical protein
MGVGLIAVMTRWGLLLGCVVSFVFAVFSLGRVTLMSNLGGPVGRIGSMARRLTVRLGAF